MGYGVRSEREEISELMRGTATADEAPPKSNQVVLNEEQMMKQVCEERL